MLDVHQLFFMVRKYGRSWVFVYFSFLLSTLTTPLFSSFLLPSFLSFFFFSLLSFTFFSFYFSFFFFLHSPHKSPHKLLFPNNTPNLNEKSNFSKLSKIHTGVVVHTIIFFFLLTWNVYANAHTTLYTVAFFYGTADAAWCTQIYSIIGRCVDPSNISFLFSMIFLNDIIFLSSSSYIL